MASHGIMESLCDISLLRLITILKVLDQQATRLFFRVPIRRQQLIQQLLVCRLHQLRRLHVLPALVTHAPDAPVLAVAARVAEIHFAVLDDRIAPVRNVERAVGAELHVDGPERDVRAAQEFVLLGRVARALLDDLEAHHAVRAEVERHGVALPLFREALALDQFQPAELRIRAGTHAADDAPRAFVSEERRLRKIPVESGAARAVGLKFLAEVVPHMAPAVDEALHRHAEFHRVRAQRERAAAVQPHHAVRRLGVRVDVNGLVHVELPVRSPAQRVQDVMRVLGAESAQHHAPLIRDAVAVGVLEVQQLGALPDVAAAVARLDAGGNQQAVGEHGGLVRDAVAVGVFEDEDFVVLRLARLDLRIDGRTGDPEPPARVPIHGDGLGEQRVLGPERDFEIGVGELEGGVGLRLERSRGFVGQRILLGLQTIWNWIIPLPHNAVARSCCQFFTVSSGFQ